MLDFRIESMNLISFLKNNDKIFFLYYYFSNFKANQEARISIMNKNPNDISPLLDFAIGSIKLLLLHELKLKFRVIFLIVHFLNFQANILIFFL